MNWTGSWSALCSTKLAEHLLPTTMGSRIVPISPVSIDNYAISVIGQERNYSDEIQDEAYLFIPFDEDDYQAMAKGNWRTF